MDWALGCFGFDCRTLTDCHSAGCDALSCSLKRALSSRNSGVRMAFIAAVGSIVAWFAATMGVYIVTGDFISFIGALNTAPSIGLAFVTFLVGALVVISDPVCGLARDACAAADKGRLIAPFVLRPNTVA